MICLLRFIDGPATGRQCWLRDDERLSIGRISTSDFPVPADMHMSRYHLMLEGVGGRFRLRDVGSSNGTYVNSQRISLAELCDGDQIQAGESKLLVSVHADRPGQDIAYFPAVETVSSRTDDSPTCQYEMDEIISLPVRSLSHSETLPARETAESDADSSRKDNQASRATGDDSTAADAGDSAAKSGSDDGPLSRIVRAMNVRQRAFQAGPIDGLLETSWGHESGATQFLDLIRAASAEFALGHCSLVINRTQLDSNHEMTLGMMVGSGEAVQISQTLISVRYSDDPRLEKIVKACVGRDALIVLGMKTSQAASSGHAQNTAGGGDSLPDLEPLGELADVLGFPSMLSGLIRGGSAEMSDRFRELVAWMILESPAHKSVCLWSPAPQE